MSGCQGDMRRQSKRRGSGLIMALLAHWMPWVAGWLFFLGLHACRQRRILSFILTFIGDPPHWHHTLSFSLTHALCTCSLAHTCRHSYVHTIHSHHNTLKSPLQLGQCQFNDSLHLPLLCPLNSCLLVVAIFFSFSFLISRFYFLVLTASPLPHFHPIRHLSHTLTLVRSGLLPHSHSLHIFTHILFSLPPYHRP